MGSSFFGDHQQLGDGRLGSSRRGRKSSSNKQKQPQRGLGVAQLEMIRLQNEMNMVVGHLPSLAQSPPFHTDLRKDLAHPSSSSSSSPSSATVAASSSSFFGAHPEIMMGFGGSAGSEIRYGDHYPGATVRSLSDPNDILRRRQQPHLLQTTTTLPLIEQNAEMRHERRRHSSGTVPYVDQNSDSELDLELRLSL